MQATDRGFVITGAGSGLGAATARRLMRAGASVLLLDRDIAAAQALCDELGERSIAVRADVTSAADVENALSLFREAFGDLHGAVNCAGVAPAEKVLGRERPHDLDAFARTIQINLVGTFNVLRLAAAQIAKNSAAEDGERGVIVNTASVAAFDGQIGQAGYAASEGRIAAMTLPVARELARVAFGWWPWRRGSWRRRCFRPCRLRCSKRLGRWCLSLRAWVVRTSSRAWCCTSSKTSTSTAR